MKIILSIFILYWTCWKEKQIVILLQHCRAHSVYQLSQKIDDSFPETLVLNMDQWFCLTSWYTGLNPISSYIEEYSKDFNHSEWPQCEPEIYSSIKRSEMLLGLFHLNCKGGGGVGDTIDPLPLNISSIPPIQFNFESCPALPDLNRPTCRPLTIWPLRISYPPTSLW